MATCSRSTWVAQDFSWRGRTVHTAVWKQPGSGPQMVRRLNIDGDGQGDLGGHGGEIRARCSSTRSSPAGTGQGVFDRDDLEHGAFGETSRSKASPTTTSASATATASGLRSSRSPNPA